MAATMCLELGSVTVLRVVVALLGVSALWALWLLSAVWSRSQSPTFDTEWAWPSEAVLWLCIVVASTRWALATRKGTDASPPTVRADPAPMGKDSENSCKSGPRDGSDISHDTRDRIFQQIRRVAQIEKARSSRCSNSVHPALLPRQLHDGGSSKRLTVVLDMDHTLLACYPAVTAPLEVIFAVDTGRVMGGRFECSREGTPVILAARPGVQQFLQKVSEIAELVVFTAAAEEYAGPLIRWLDPEGRLFSAALFRDSTVRTRYQDNVKDLSTLGRDLGRTVLVDDRPLSCLLQPFNLLPCAPFQGDPSDDRLLNDVLKSLEYLARVNDVRPALKAGFRMNEYMRACGIPADYLQECASNTRCTCHLKLSPADPAADELEDLLS